MLKIEKQLPSLKYWNLSFAIILSMVFFFIPESYLKDTFPICLYQIIFGKECLGCGTTRAIWSILHFNFLDAYNYNKMIIITFPLTFGCMIKWLRK